MVLLLALASWFPFGLLVCLVHEAGHATICEIDGYKWTFYYNIWRGCAIACPPSDGSDWRNNMMGSVYGTILTGTILLVSFPQIRKQPYLFMILPAVALMYLPDQISKIVIEGFYFPFYKSVEGVQLVTMIQGASMTSVLPFVTWQYKKHHHTPSN